MDEIISLIAKTWGIAGLLILAPFVGLVIVWKENRRLTKELASIAKDNEKTTQSLNDKVNEIQGLRVRDAQDIGNRLIGMVQEQSSLNKETNLALDKVGDVLSILQAKLKIKG